MPQGEIANQTNTTSLHNNIWLQAFVQNMPYPTMLVDNNRTIVAVNQQLCDFFSLPYQAASVAGRNTFDILMELSALFKDPASIEKRVIEIVTQRQPVFDDRIETTDGRVIFRDYSPFNLEGEFLGHFWIFYDETHIIKAWEVVSQQKFFYEDVLNKIPSDVAVLSPEMKYLFVNPEAVQDDETRKWIIGKTDFDFCRERNIDIALAENRKKIFEKVLAEKKELEWEEEINRHNIISHHLRKISPVLDDDNNVKLLIGYGYNITQRKKYEEQVAISEKKYKDLFDYSQALICTHDMNGVVMEVNPAFCEQIGFTPDEVIGKSIGSFLPEGDKSLFDSNYLQPMRVNKRVKGLFRALNKSGQLVYLLYQNYKVEPKNGDSYVIGFSQDVTERIKIENELKEAKKITEETARLKDKFLANMSHEIRTPMNGIMGIASLLQKTILNTEQSEYVKVIQDSAQTLLNIINDILDFEKIGSGNIHLEEIPFSVTEKLQSSMGLFKAIAQDRNLQLTLIVNFADGLIVLGDPTRFAQILNNLIGNAIKFTHEGGVTVTASVVEASEQITVIHVSVSDTGIGIADKGLEKIFSPFIQAYPETTRMYGGTGLGLAISKNLADIQKGRIWVDSELNIGSTFHFEIPFKTHKQDIEMSQKPPLKQSRVINRKVKVLLAEDNDINQLLANKILQHFGFEAKTADNGNDAIKYLLDEDFDVILMDIQMPEKNGIETSTEIRKLPDEKKSKIPIIALTANALKGEEKKYFDAGMNGYLTKPFKEKELYEAITNVLPEEYLSSPEPAEPQQGGSQATANAAPEPKLYNLDDLRLIQKDDDSFVKNIVGLFIQNVPKNAAELIVASDSQDWERAYFLAHKMKSSIELVNINSIRDAVKRVELNAKTKTNLEEIPAKAAFIDATVQKAAAQMKEEFGL